MKAERLALKGRVGEREVFALLGEGLHVLGSDPASHVVLDHEGISRRHAILLVDSRGLSLIDQRSKNGTFVNGQRIQSAEVAVGDEIWIGPAELRLEALAAADAELAVEIEETPPADSRDGRRTTEVVQRSPDPRLGLWLGLVHRACERLSDPASGAVGALAAVVETLGIEGIALVELAAGGETWVHAAAGDLGEGLEACLWGDGGLAEEGELTVLRRPGIERSAALVLRGDFPGRSESEPLLEALLSLHLGMASSLGASASSSRADERRPLVFPEGYVAGISTPARRLHRDMEALTVGDLPVLIVGETGVGKEVLARTLHLSSPRAAAPFVAINCAAIPAELLEAELFGVGKGVATGVAARRGKLVLAEGGTLFLDEITEMPPELQAKLLRALQEKEVQPLGERPVTIDLRVLAATNVDVAARLESGAFRHDLYYRIAGAVLRVPPLRERSEDVPILVDRFLRRFVEEASRPIRGLSVAALRTLQTYPWPGNVRQLEHEVRRLVHLCPPGQAIRSALLSEEIRRGAPTTVEAAEPTSNRRLPTLNLDQLEHRALEQALKESAGNQSEAARLLGITRFTLRRRLERHGL